MRIFFFFVFLTIGVILFVRKKQISDEFLQRMANVAAIVFSFVSALILIIPSPTNTEQNQTQNALIPTSTIKVILLLRIAHLLRNNSIKKHLLLNLYNLILLPFRLLKKSFQNMQLIYQEFHLNLATAYHLFLIKIRNPRMCFPSLSAGQTIMLTFSGTSPVEIDIFKPGTITVIKSKYDLLCFNVLECTNTFNIAVTGTYYVWARTAGSGVKYSLTINELDNISLQEFKPDIPGTPFELGDSITSILDGDTKRAEVFSLSLTAGQTLIVAFTGSSPVEIDIFKPGTTTVVNTQYDTLCFNVLECNNTFNVAVTGTYYIWARTDGSGVKYDLTIRSKSLSISIYPIT